MNRIYILTYDIYLPKGGAYKYAAEPEKESRVNYYSKLERDLFIQEYLRLSHKDKDMYIDNIKCFTALPEQVVDVKQLIDAI